MTNITYNQFFLSVADFLFFVLLYYKIKERNWVLFCFKVQKVLDFKKLNFDKVNTKSTRIKNDVGPLGFYVFYCRIPFYASKNH